ncbi:hypothetical protein IM793_11490 [Pedobacter sp. MR2016-19]|uniref:hypothetical protein n=1 Tax=Pedobacter sp. MR2016-19 TaxID=2780089 RepID=UPI0018752931|nr:hypothetical protein [Pedobacter sp. MR2016-19]MBE5319784.1 hypothetical protein [Pedobacter sp. MR2016-19]
MQPGLKRIEEIGDLLEVDNIELIASKYRKPTGLAGKLQLEYKRLLSEGMQIKVVISDAKGNQKEVNNPAMVEALRDFVAKNRS